MVRRETGLTSRPAHSGHQPGTSRRRGAILDSQIRLEIAQRAPRLTFIHAGVVAVNDRAILLPGPSFAGKTTLVAALIANGASYLSDEFAPLDDHGLVHPYPRLLSLRPPGTVRAAPVVPSTDRPASAFGAITTDRALPVGLMAILTYRSEGELLPRELSAGEGALRLMSHSATAREHPEVVMTRARRTVTGARIIEAERGEADTAAHWLITQATLTV